MVGALTPTYVRKIVRTYIILIVVRRATLAWMDIKVRTYDVEEAFILIRLTYICSLRPMAIPVAALVLPKRRRNSLRIALSRPWSPWRNGRMVVRKALAFAEDLLLIRNGRIARLYFRILSYVKVER